ATGGAMSSPLQNPAFLSPPKKMKYDYQVLTLFSPDLEPIAKNLENKRKQAGDAEKSITYRIANAGERIPLDNKLTDSSPVYLIGHCASQEYLGGMWYLMMAQKIKAMKKGGVKIKRISIIGCFAGGNPSGHNNCLAFKRSDSFAGRLFQALGPEHVETMTART